MVAILESEVAMPADEKKFVNVPLDVDLLAQLDEYRFERRFRSRTAAMTFLLRWAVERNPEPPAEARN